MALSALELSEQHLAQVEALYRASLALVRETGADTPLEASEQNIAVLKSLYSKAQLARMGPHVARVHRKSHAWRIEEEMKWQAVIEQVSDRLFAQLDIDAAYTAAVRGWVIPPDDPADGAFTKGPGVLGVVKTWLSKAAGNRLSGPKPSDAEEVARWGGNRGAQAELALMSQDQSHVRVLRDEQGRPLAVASVAKEGDSLNVRILGAQEGNGAKMMQMLAREAARDGLGMHLVSTHAAEGFYKRIGMQDMGGGKYAFDGARANVFAKTGGYLAPAGEATPGLTEAENLIAQQMILSIFQGGPVGERMPEAVERALASRMNAEAFQRGAVTQYLGLAADTSTRAGQISLEHMGLHKTFEWAHPQNMARDMFQVRGSKVIQNMYGNHINKLSKIIVDATNPRTPATVQEVTRTIKQEWPRLRMWQAERIARTETAAVWTATSAAAYEANGIEEWESLVAQGPGVDADTVGACDFCVEMGAEQHEIADDPPPWHPNCRCEMIPVLDREAEDGEMVPWLPPDEPWTGGGRGSGVQEFEPRPVQDIPMPKESVPLMEDEATTLKEDIEAAQARVGAMETERATLLSTGQAEEARLLGYQIEGEQRMIEGWMARLGDTPIRPPSDIPGGFLAGEKVDFKRYGQDLHGEVVGRGVNDPERVRVRFTNANGIKNNAEVPVEDVQRLGKYGEPGPDVPPPPEPTVQPPITLKVTNYTPEELSKETTGNLWRALSRNGRAENQAQKDIAYDQDKAIANELWRRWERDPDAGLPEGTLRYSDLAGEQHLHSVYSDGHNTIKEMAESSRAHGKTQMVISDHSHLVDDAATIRQHKEIDELNKWYAEHGINFRVIKGIEVNLLEHGGLDLTEEQLARYEVVNVGMHVARSENATARYLDAMDNPYVTTIAHPHTGGDVVDWDALAKKAAEKNIALEVNGRDILRMQTDEAARKMIRAAKKYKVKIQIASDAHNDTGVIDGLYAARFAAKEGVKAEDIIDGQRVVDDVSIEGAGPPINQETLSAIKKWNLDHVDEMPLGEKGKAFLGTARDTKALHTDDLGRYDRESQQYHERAIREFVGDHAAQEKPVALVMAGGPAAGKSVARRANPDLDPHDAVVVNPDEVMEHLRDYKTLFGDPGMAAALHEEASDVASEILHTAIARRTNLVLDGCGDAGPGKFLSKLEALKQAGYEVKVVVADAPVNAAIERSVARAIPKDSPDYGRFLPVRTLKGLYRDVSARMDEWIASDAVDEWVLMRTGGSWGDTNAIRVAEGGKGEYKVLDKELWQEMQDKRMIDAGEGAPVVHTPERFPTPQWIDPATWNEEQFDAILRGVVGKRVRITSTSYSGGEPSVTEGILEESSLSPLKPGEAPTLVIENRTLGNGKFTEHIEVQGEDGQWHTLTVMPEDIRPKPKPKTETPTPTNANDKPTFSGEVVKPSARFDLQATRDAEFRAQRQEFIDNLDTHIRIPTEAVPLKFINAKTRAHFSPPGPNRKGVWEGAHIKMGPGDRAGFEPRMDVLDTGYHEFGHYLDFTLTPDSWAGTRYASEAREEFKPLMQELFNSPEIQEWREFYKNPGLIPDNVWAPKGHIKYMTSSTEMFARAFTQYMATVTKDEELLAYVAAHVGHGEAMTKLAGQDAGAWFWTPEHFAPIKKEMDDLFDKLGIRVEPKAEVEGEARPVAWEKATAGWYGKVTGAEDTAIRHYTDEASDAINSMLRGDTKGTEGDRAAAEFIRDALGKASSPEATVYRSGPNMQALFGGARHFGEENLVGKTFTDKAFMSTTTRYSKTEPHDTVLRIHVPEGSQAAYVRMLSEYKSEDEVIIQAGSRFKVTAVGKEDGKTVIDLDLQGVEKPHEAPPKPEPTPAPKAPEAPAGEDRGEGGFKGTPVPPGTFLQTREGFERVLASYEGRTVRVKYGYGSGQEVGEVKFKHGKWWVGRANFYSFDTMRSIEVKVGGRYKDMWDFEKLTPEQRDRVVETTTTRTASGEKVKIEVPEPEGGWQFPDAPPSGVIGDYPETPIFKSVTEAKAFAEKFLAREVEFTQSKTDLAGIQDALDGLASVLRPFGVKLERLQVEKPKGVKALAYYIEAGGSRPITVNGQKTYWKREMIQAQVRTFNRKAMIKEAGTDTIQKFEFVKGTNIAQWKRWIEREDTEHRTGWETRKAQYERQIAAYEACPRYWVASATPEKAGQAIMAHEAGHALSYNMGEAMGWGEDGCAAIFEQELIRRDVTDIEKWQVSKYGATGDNARQQAGSELWAECSAAKATGQWDIIPPKIQEAYQAVLDKITPEAIAEHMAKTAERDAFWAGTEEEKAQRIVEQLKREQEAKDAFAARGRGEPVEALEPLTSLNPTGGVFVKYGPEARANAPIGGDLTTLDKTMEVGPDEMVTIYRGTPGGKIVPGDFVTTNEQLARDYAGSGKVVSMKVPASHVLDDASEPLGEEYIYRPPVKTEVEKRWSDIRKKVGLTP